MPLIKDLFDKFLGGKWLIMDLFYGNWKVMVGEDVKEKKNVFWIFGTFY